MVLILERRIPQLFPWRTVSPYFHIQSMCSSNAVVWMAGHSSFVKLVASHISSMSSGHVGIFVYFSNNFLFCRHGIDHWTR
jgi:hypothetical protein